MQERRLSPQAKIIHIDIDRSEIGKLCRAYLGLVGDVGQVLESLLPRVETKPASPWIQRVVKLKNRHALPSSNAGDGPSAHTLIRLVADRLDERAIIVTDVGQHQMWTAQAFPFRGSQQWLTSGGLGTMGFGLPAAIGAALAAPGQPVLLFSGDGSIMMNIQELATAVEENINIKIFLMNNNSLGLVRQQQSLFFGNRRFASGFSLQPDFCAIARGFGMPAWDLESADYPHKLLDEALRNPGPALIHASIREADVLPMVPPGEANRNMIQGGCHAGLAI